MNVAIRNARQQSRSGPRFNTGYCALAVRTMMGVPSSGDFDHDGDADAMDAWERVPEAHKHRTTDPRKIPRGAAVFWSGGSEGHGHVAIATGWFSRCYSTDITRDGYFDRVPISEIHDRWGLTLLGWTDQLGGKDIPVSKVFHT